jgi:hypothetical protein
MKKMILATIVSLMATAAMADIPNMGGNEPKEPITKSSIAGAAAEAVYESSSVASQTEAALRTSTTTVKVIRSEDGMDQVVCSKTSTMFGRKRVSYQCDTQSSNTDKKLPVYKLLIRMG